MHALLLLARCPSSGTRVVACANTILVPGHSPSRPVGSFNAAGIVRALPALLITPLRQTPRTRLLTYVPIYSLLAASLLHYISTWLSNFLCRLARTVMAVPQSGTGAMICLLAPNAARLDPPWPLSTAHPCSSIIFAIRLSCKFCIVTPVGPLPLPDDTCHPPPPLPARRCHDFPLSFPFPI